MSCVWKKNLVGLLLAGLLIGMDQWTKILAQKKLSKGAFPIWDGVFELSYVRNQGAAFGILQNQKWFFVICTIVAVGGILWIFLRTPATKKYLAVNTVCVLLLSGALGNFIDRIRLGYVIDFLYFKLIDFPVFNVADCYITVSCILAVLLIFFVYGEEDFQYLSKNSK